MIANVYWYARHRINYHRHPALHMRCTCRGTGNLGRKPWRRR